MKQNLKTIEEEKKRIFDQKKLKQELTLVVTNLEDFSSNIALNLDNADWLTKRDTIRTLVKRIEINLEDVNVVFRVKELPNSSGHNGEEKKNLRHCWRSKVDAIGRTVAFLHNLMHHSHDKNVLTFSLLFLGKVNFVKKWIEL